MILFEEGEIVIIITFDSGNIKTGNMCQIWILNKDVDPVTALKNGESEKICFDCPHLENGTCYVNTGQAPLSVYRAYKRGIYAPLNMNELKAKLQNRCVRFGAYGEPVLIPFSLVEFIAKHAKKITGYTHQWDKLEYLEYNKYFMASADTINDVVMANSIGWRTYRVKGESDQNLKNEIDCPYEKMGILCIDCGLCNGFSKGKNIAVNVHGIPPKINKFNLLNIGAKQ